MQQAKAHGKSQKKQRYEAGFDIALFDVGIAKSLRVLLEPVDLRCFLGSCLDGFNPVNVFRQTAV